MTKNRIMFVDDEALVLQGLQRTLRPMRNEWDMEFLSDGAAALARLSETPFDVVVSDMMMPGMNGAELLNQVMLRHPKTVRLILSGHADRELILKCVGSTHQYLSKPCEVAALKTTITRALSLEGSLQNERVTALVSQLDKLPSLPSVYAEMMLCLQSPNCSMESLGEIVAKDIAMTAKILKLVNSAFFGLGRQISNPAEAVSYLGTELVKSLVLSVHVFSQFESARIKGFSPEALWAHSMRTGGAAKAIAKAERASPNVVNEAFVAGMLHDSGKLVLAMNFPDQYARALELAEANQGSLLGAEREVFGCSHPEVGGYLLGLWGLPVPVVEAIALHHSPARSEPIFSALTITHVANALVHQLDGDVTEPALDLNYLGNLGMSERIAVWEEVVRENFAQPTAAHAAAI
ncbi:MAG TPA: response regulator [Candidatus Acidoferrum sp.]|nr:response regulator [Candidatus Acidoferrum sp.]